MLVLFIFQYLLFVQEARSKEGKPIVTKSTTYQKLRSEATTR